LLGDEGEQNHINSYNKLTDTHYLFSKYDVVLFPNIIEHLPSTGLALQNFKKFSEDLIFVCKLK
jgi:hypothetical protein